MALQALWAPETQFQNKNGSLLVNGKIYVQYRGRTQLARTYRDPNGSYQNTNPLMTDNDGRVLCYADDSFSYTAVVCDFYGNELFSFDPIPCGSSSSGGGSASAGTAEHWLGWNGASVSVPSNTDTRLRMPAGMDNVDYDGEFLRRIESSGTEMVLEEGLYLVNAVIRFQQSSSDLTNELSNVVIHTRDFDSANMQEVGAIFRDEAGPDSSSDIHTISMTFVRHAYEDDVGSDRLKFEVETPNTWSSCYIQNLQIAKLGSSVSGGGTVEPYDPGQYISIENHVISVTGIDPDSYLTSADLNGYATEQWVLDKNYITSADIPPIPDDYVTSAELAQTSGAIEQDISDLTSAVTEALADKMDKSSSADFYPRYSNPEGYLTSVPSEYVTESEMGEYVSEHTSSFITSADLPDVSDMATQTWVTDQNYITSADIPPIPEDVVTSGELATVSGEIVNQIPSLQGYATEQYVTDHTSAFITSADLPDVSDMATQTWVQNQGYLTSVPSEYVTDSELESAISGKADTSAIPDVSHFVTQEDIDSSVSGKMDSSEASAFYPMATNPSGYLVSSDLNGYATETYVTDHTSAFITSADVPEYSAGQYIDITNKTISVSPVKSLVAGENVTISASGDNYVISSVGGGSTYSAGQYISIENDTISVTGLQPAGSYATEQYVQDYTSGFVDTSYVSEYVASQVSGKQDELTFGYNASNKINAINGSALAGDGGGTTYSAGDNIDITDDVISVTDTSNLIAGANVSITSSGDDYVISSVAGSTYSAGQYVSISGDVISVTGLQPAGNYATQADLASYATQTYVDSAVSGKQDTLTFNYNAQNLINAINGSGIAQGGGGGGGHEYVGLNGVTVDNVLETIGLDTSAANAVQAVVENSGAWGGEGLPISAGPGISMSMESGTLVIGSIVDETSIYTSNNPSDSITTSEIVTNFERLRLELKSNQSQYVKMCVECLPDSGNLVYTCTTLIPAADYPLQMAGVRYTSNNGINFSFNLATRMCYRPNSTYGDQSTTSLVNSDIKDVGYITKIVGIGRKQST